MRKRLALMRYLLFRRAGRPIGSGMVERANKHVVEARPSEPLIEVAMIRLLVARLGRRC